MQIYNFFCAWTYRYAIILSQKQVLSCLPRKKYYHSCTGSNVLTLVWIQLRSISHRYKYYLVYTDKTLAQVKNDIMPVLIKTPPCLQRYKYYHAYTDTKTYRLAQVQISSHLHRNKYYCTCTDTNTITLAQIRMQSRLHR